MYRPNGQPEDGEPRVQPSDKTASVPLEERYPLADEAQAIIGSVGRIFGSQAEAKVCAQLADDLALGQEERHYCGRCLFREGRRVIAMPILIGAGNQWGCERGHQMRPDQTLTEAQLAKRYRGFPIVDPLTGHPYPGPCPDEWMLGPTQAPIQVGPLILPPEDPFAALFQQHFGG